MKEVRKIAGVDAVVTRTVTDLHSYLAINCRLIDAETGRVFSAAQVRIVKDEDVEIIRRATLPAPSGSTPSSAETAARLEKVQEVREQGMLFSLNGCFHGGSQIRCELSITSNASDRELMADRARLVDSSGNDLVSYDVSLGSSRSAQVGGQFVVRSRAQLVSDVPMRAEVRFQGASPQATAATLLELVFEGATITIPGFGGGSSSDRGVRIRFRDVPLIAE